MKVSSYRKRKRSNGVLNLIFLVIGGIAAIWLSVWLSHDPALQPLRDSLLYTVVLRAILSGVFIHFTFFGRNKPLIGGKLIVILLMSILWLPFVIWSPKIMLTLKIVATFISGAILLYDGLVGIETNRFASAAFGLIAFFNLSSMTQYTFACGPNELPFWKPIVGITIATVIVTAIVMHIMQIKTKWHMTISILLLSAMCAFALSWTTISHMNYIFDSSKTVIHAGEVFDKHIENHRGMSTYYLRAVRSDATGIIYEPLTIKVYQSDYYKYEIGDSISLSLYDGFFNEPYYILND